MNVHSTLFEQMSEAPDAVARISSKQASPSRIRTPCKALLPAEIFYMDQRYFLKVLAVILTARANASANGRRIQDGCTLTGDTRYSTQADRNDGRAAFLA